MTVAIAVLTPRSGSGSTTWATSLAWTLAETRQVLLIDADMQGGTIADLLRPGSLRGRSIARLYAPDTDITAEQIMGSVVKVPKRPNLHIIPGFQQFSGPPVSDFIFSIQNAFKKLPEDIVICDLGQCLSYPGLSDPRGEAEAISAAFSRVFVVLRDDPVLAPHAIETLAAAHMPQAELVVVQSRPGALTEQIHQALKERVADLPIRAYWPWDEKRAYQMSHTGIPFDMNKHVESLHI